MKLYVLIPTYLRVESCLSLVKTLVNSPDFHLIHAVFVVEVGKATDLRSRIEAFGNQKLKYLFSRSRSKSTALNLALNAIKDEEALIVFFDDDVKVHAGIIESYFKAASEFGPGNYFGGPTQAEYEVLPTEFHKKYWPPSAMGLRYEQARGYTQPNIFFLGFN